MPKNLQPKALEDLRLPELQAKFAEVTGEMIRSPNRKFLVRKITEALRVQAEPGVREVAADTAGVSESAVPKDKPAIGKLTRMDVPELPARYADVVGRPTGSENKAYLIWKIREAQKGRIPVGPRKSAHREGVSFKVLPLRLETALVDKMDEAWQRLGLHSRTDLFRKWLRAFFQGVGESDVAALLATSPI